MTVNAIVDHVLKIEAVAMTVVCTLLYKLYSLERERYDSKLQVRSENSCPLPCFLFCFVLSCLLHAPKDTEAQFLNPFHAVNKIYRSHNELF